MDRKLYIIAGCNGSGKTTISFSILPGLNCHEFVNADEIAKGLSPLNPSKAAIPAGRIMVTRLNELIESNLTFALETTLASRSYVNKINRAHDQGYKVSLLFFWLQNADLAIERVKTRVKEGGHNITTPTIRRRYKRGIENLFKLYLDIVDEVMIFDNSDVKSVLIAEKTLNSCIHIQDDVRYDQLISKRDEKI